LLRRAPIVTALFHDELAYHIFIQATAQDVWDALTRPGWTQKYGYRARVKYDPQPGGIYLAYCVPTKTLTCAHVALWRAGAAKAMQVPGSASVTARLRDRPEMNGNGWAGSTTSGVSTG